MKDAECGQCKKFLRVFPSRIKYSKTGKVFCDRSCMMAYRNRIDNPSWYRDISGKNNPMYGKHPAAWNKGLTGEKSATWKGGVHRRKDGYYRISVDGKRKLLHRYLLGGKLKDGYVVHHIDHNPSNNSIENLMIFESQSEHVKYEARIKKKKKLNQTPL